MLNSYDIRQLACLEADIISQNAELSLLEVPAMAEIIVMNEQQLEIIRELRSAALN